MSNAPRYAHHCELCEDRGGCVWLGHHDHYDLYACSSRERGVVLYARYGASGKEVASFAMRLYRGTPEELPEPFYAAYTRLRVMEV